MATHEQAMPEWTPEQRAALERECARIGFRKDQLLPAPQRDLTPEEALTLFRSVPDGSGLQGYLAALARFFGKK